jgi:serine phosphatase RsbU (regulator of sigma subunit)/CHASE3 domain sensor protein
LLPKPIGVEDTGEVKLSLRWKIVGGFGLLLLLVALLGWVTLSLFTSLRNVQRRVFDDAVPGLVTVDEIVLAYTAQSAAVRGSLIGSGGQRTLLDQYEAEVARSDAAEVRARELFRSGRELEILQRLTEAGEQFHELVETEVIPAAEQGRRSQAFRVMEEEGAGLIQDIEVEGELLRQLQQQRVVRSETESRSATRQALLILVVVLVGVLGIGMALAIVLPRRLARDLSRLVEAARAIGRGDFEQRFNIHSGDEIEELAARFGEMQAGLKRLQQLALQDRELEIAASIQRNLLLRSLPDTPEIRIVPVQRQANLVGGDWYDVDLSGRQLNVVVGDASGKGIAAALMATVALSFLRAERGLGSTAKRVVERTNGALLDATDPDSFTTLIYATIDLDKGGVRWLNMGHPSPFLLRLGGADGAGVRGYYLEGPRNKALGWFEDPGLAETLVQLRPRDCLVLFTDGWIEAKSPTGEVFGEKRFADALLRLAPLGTDAIGEQLVGEVERFAAGKLDDDLTMLMVEFEGAPVARTATDKRTGEQAWHSKR